MLPSALFDDGGDDDDDANLVSGLALSAVAVDDDDELDAKEDMPTRR